MPARSEAQRRYLAAKFGAAWMRRHHFDNEGKLPAHAHGKALLALASRKRKAA